MQGTDEGKDQWGLSQLCGVFLVCGCGRFGRSRAFSPGTGNRWCWENKLLSLQPCWSVPGVSLPRCLRPLSSLPSFFLYFSSHSFILIVFLILWPSALTQWLRPAKPIPLHAPPVLLSKRESRMTSVG